MYTYQSDDRSKGSKGLDKSIGNMADGGGGWDDLFAMAAGDERAAVSATAVAGTKRQHLVTSDTKKKAKKKKNKKDRHQRLNRNQPDDANNAHLERMLKSRMDISSEATRHWPAWVRPGGSLLVGASSSCPGYAGSYDASDDGNYDPRKKRMCSSCGECPLHHELVVDTSSMPTGARDTCVYDHLIVFLSNRNVRACASIALAEQRKARRREGKTEGDTGDANANALVRAYAKAALQHVKEITSKIYSLTSGLSSGGEASILGEKCSALHRAVKAWRSFRDGVPADFDTIVRVIIASDVFYYRLYYLQLTGALPISASGAHIPHPTTYLVADRLCWDTVGGARCVRKLLKRGDCGGRIPEIVQKYSMTTPSESSSAELEHPLIVLKSNTFAQTLLLFGDWTKDVQTKKEEFAKAVKSAARNLLLQSSTSSSEDLFYSAHECPAPQVLVEWRNVSRDLICNLYAYATLSVDHLKSHPVCASAGILEVGAGTGYYAYLLQMAGIDVMPSDIANTDASMNEYHGSTPSFTRVEMGDIVKLKSDLRQFRKKSPALLLCYPPPLSTMAHDALKVFIETGGNTVVHCGEFRGLTGSSAFERLLLDRFRCVSRKPCLSWSTDASSLTVWEAVTTNNASTATDQTLIPCSNCKSKPSTKRFRLIRSLAYCSEECYKEHKSERSAHALCSMIPNDIVERASFNDEAYMMALTSRSTRSMI